MLYISEEWRTNSSRSVYVALADVAGNSNVTIGPDTAAPTIKSWPRRGIEHRIKREARESKTLGRKRRPKK